MSELKTSLKKFHRMLEKFPDDPKHAYDFLYFIRNFVRIKHPTHPTPTVEMGAILKEEKPKIFRSLKDLSSYNYAIDVITHTGMDPNKARKRIEELTEKL